MLATVAIKATRLAAWLLLAAITFFTLGPAQDRPQTSFSHDLEHALAFIPLGIAFGCGYATRRTAIAIVGVPVIGVIEILQLWAPGRHARLEDFIINLLAFWIALAISILVEYVFNQTNRSVTSSKN